MTNNFVISLRNDTGRGVPGTSFGMAASYIEIPDGSTNYNLQEQKDKAQWLADIPANSPVLVFVHGFGNDSYKVMARHNTLKPHVPPGMTLVSFDWPSGNTGPDLMPYKYDRQYAASSASYFLRDCLEALRSKCPPGSIHLFAHSMGAYVIERAFQSSNEVFAIGHVLLAAADVDQLHYGGGLLENYLRHCNDLSVYWSTDDKALKDSKTINGYDPLGLGGFKTQVPDRCSSILCNTYFESYALRDPPPDPPAPPPSPPNLPPAPMAAAEYTHVWYLLYAPTPPPVNDFYTDIGLVLQDAKTFPTRQQSPRDKNAFALQRPQA
jgi:pimeloyl-ACP methyl ester carboxylesterase